MKIGRTLAALSLTGFSLASAAPAPAGDVSALTFPPRPSVVASNHYVFPLCVAAVGQVQAAYRTGEDTPLSAQYLMDRIGASDGPGGQITSLHGFTSPTLGWQFLHDVGTCPASMCPPLKFRTTAAMDTAAIPYRCGGFVLPTDYASSVTYIAAHPGACLLVSTYGYEGYVFIQADADGVATALDYNQHTGPPDVLTLTLDEGAALWRRMAEGQPYSWQNYVLIVDKL